MATLTSYKNDKALQEALWAILGWPKPNYVNPVRRDKAMPVVMSVLLLLCSIIVSIRIYTRCRILKSFCLDDILILAAFVSLNQSATTHLLG